MNGGFLSLRCCSKDTIHINNAVKLTAFCIEFQRSGQDTRRLYQLLSAHGWDWLIDLWWVTQTGPSWDVPVIAKCVTLLENEEEKALGIWHEDSQYLVSRTSLKILKSCHTEPVTRILKVCIHITTQRWHSRWQQKSRQKFVSIWREAVATWRQHHSVSWAAKKLTLHVVKRLLLCDFWGEEGESENLQQISLGWNGLKWWDLQFAHTFCSACHATPFSLLRLLRHLLVAIWIHTGRLFKSRHGTPRESDS